MSETTSTNISVGQANSTESIQAFSARHSRMTDPGPTKKLCFYKSGDPRFNGIKMVVTNRSFKTFDALLDSLSKKVPLPFGVRNISTPRGQHHITSLEELEDGKSYICSHQRKIKPINLEKASKKPLLWQSSRPISARRRVAQLARQNVVSPFQRENTVVLGNSKNFVIFKNGDKDSKYNLVLKRKSVQSFDMFLDQVSEALQFPVFKLYSTDGRRILSTHALLLSSGTIVAAGREPFKPGNYDSEREFLPPKLPGIPQRVFPKSRSKPEIKSHVKDNESFFTSPSGQAHSQSPANVCHNDDNLVGDSQIHNNKICLTERWPQYGEQLPVISPGDNIEKTVHLNSDGTMTVEMKVRFKLAEEETINWSTTVSRADMSYCKTRLLNSPVNPEIEAVSTKDSPLENTDVDTKIDDERKNSVGYTYESHVERIQSNIQDNDINTNKYRTSSTRKDKSYFYRPPTPGIRKTQERANSVRRRASEGNVQRNMKQMFRYQEMAHEAAAQSVESRTQMFMTADNVHSTKAPLKRSAITCKGAENFTDLSEGNFELLQATQMQLVNRDTVQEKDVESDYSSVSGPSKNDRPHSAGKRIYMRDEFKFREIKRSMSASVTYSEPYTELPKLHTKTTNLIQKCSNADTESVCTEPSSNAKVLMANVLSSNTTVGAHKAGVMDYLSSTSGDRIDRGSENETCASNDNSSISSVTQKKKKKKKAAGDPSKQIQTNIPNCDATDLKSQQQVSGVPCQEMNSATKNIMFEEIFPSHLSSSHQPEQNTIRKAKSDKKMAKVKPRSVKTHDELINSDNQKEGQLKQNKENTEVDLITGYNGTIMENSTTLNPNDQAQSPFTQDSSAPNGQSPKKSSKTSKKSLKAAKKPKQSKKKTKNNKSTDGKTASSSNSLESEDTNSPTLPSLLESYVQNWLKNILPNAALPMLQTISATEPENGVQSQPHDVGVNANTDKTTTKTAKSVLEASQEERVGKETSADKTLIQSAELYEDSVSTFMEKNIGLAEQFLQRFTDFRQDNSCESYKPEELIKCLANNQLMNPPQKKSTTDAAIQVENVTFKRGSTDYVGDLLKEQYAFPQNRLKQRQLEKSYSLPNTPLKAAHSSSPQLLLAWLIVLHLQRGMFHMVEALSQGSSNSTAVFTLLQSLKKIAITEQANDLKAAILHLQESAVRFDTAMKTFPSDFIPKDACSNVLNNNTEMHYTEADNTANPQIVAELCEKPNIIKNDEECATLEDDMDDLRFFSSLPYRELSGEFCKNAASDNPEECSALESHSNYVSTDSLEKSEQPIVTEKCPEDFSQACTQNKAGDNPEEFCVLESHQNDVSPDSLEKNEQPIDTEKCPEDLLLACMQNEASDNPENFCVLESHQNDVSPDPLEKTEKPIIIDTEKCPEDLPQVRTPPPKLEVISENSHTTERSPASPKVSKVKMMVQEMEQRKCCSHASEHQKTLQSPVSSDWSDYRQDSEESGDRVSSEIMTESGEELISEKPFKAGFVKRTIERLYGKGETKIILPKTYASPRPLVEKQPEDTAENENIEYMSSSYPNQGNVSRSSSGPSNRMEGKSDTLKSTSMSLLEANDDHDCFIFQRFGSSHKSKQDFQSLNEDNLVKTDQSTKGGVLIDKGRWLLKEDHLVRKSPPERTGMYGNTDTTSADTFLDNTSDDVPYLHSACKMGQPLAEVSSSELEDMVKPQSYSCHYFSMPHGSDSEPFNDAFSLKSKVRPKSSGGIMKNKKHNSKESLEKSGTLSGSLPSFATVDLHFSDNKIHPLPQSGVETIGDAQPEGAGASRRQVVEQDSLDKLQIVCGQHCPILTAIICPINERDRGFIYRRPYDVENQVLSTVDSGTAFVNMLTNSLFTDENNNIHNIDFSEPVKSSLGTNLGTVFIWDDTNSFRLVNLLKNTSADQQSLSNLFPISIQKIAIASKVNTTQQTYWTSKHDFIRNDENNNILYHSS